MASGQFVRTSFSHDGENLAYATPEKVGKLKGQDVASGKKLKSSSKPPNTRSVKKHHLNGHCKITEPLQPKNAKVIGPAQLAPTKPCDESSKDRSSKKQKVQASPAKQEATKESLFEGFSGNEPPTVDSSVHLLVQGLESGDRRMLDTVFGQGDETIIKNTIDKLPLDVIPALLNVLRKYLYYKGDNNTIYMRWLEKLIHSKLSFILTVS